MNNPDQGSEGFATPNDDKSEADTKGGFSRVVSRRTVLNAGLAAGAGVGGGLLSYGAIKALDKVFSRVDDNGGWNDVFINEIKVGSAPEIPVFQKPGDFKELAEAREWTDETLLKAFNKGVGESLASGRLVEIQLPEGEIVIHKRLDIAIPEGAKIALKGDKNGSRLRLDSRLSDIPKEWGSFGQQNALYFKDMDGELVIDGIEFHGGSERAGRQGYAPPKSPWDSMVFVVGSGEGSGPDQHAVMRTAGKRKGRAEVKNCNFQNSESGGFMAQNVGMAVGTNLQGKNLDALFNASWCDQVGVKNMKGERFASDGLYITNAQTVVLEDLQVSTARQAFDLQGNGTAHLLRCRAYDSAIAFDITKSETDGTLAGPTFIEDSDSSECMSAFALGGIQKIAVKNSKNFMGGQWQDAHDKGEFLHADGIADSNDADNYRAFGIYDLAAANPDNVKFSDVLIHIGKNYSAANSFPKFKGVGYTRDSA